MYVGEIKGNVDITVEQRKTALSDERTTGFERFRDDVLITIYQKYCHSHRDEILLLVEELQKRGISIDDI